MASIVLLQWIVLFWNFLLSPVLSLTICGQPAIRTRVDGNIGATDAIPYSWPWQVVVFQYSYDFGWRHICSGALISNQWVLTAAHCLYEQPLASKYQIKLGVFNKVNNMEDQMEVVSSVSEVYLHPEFDRRTMSNDVALMELAVPIMFNDHVSPICTPQAGMPLPAAGATGVITGWGLMASDGASAVLLRQAKVTMVSQEECKLDYPQQFRDRVMFCGAVHLGEKDSCEGDTGGPLVYYDKDTQQWTQLGVASWAFPSCGLPTKPGVYSKVSAFTVWIQKFTDVNFAG